MARLALPQVTLVAIDARAPSLASEALQRSMAQVDFGRVVLLTHGASLPTPLPGMEVIDVGAIRSGAEYSHFVLRRLVDHVHTPYVLVTQWDGFVVDASAWSDEFLHSDYVGAVWSDPPAAGLVGNGGFSLRSHKLLEAGRDPRIVEEHPEDLMLCQRYRALLEREHGIRFARPLVARRFAFENEKPEGPTFGFHGPYNLPRFVEESMLSRWLDSLPDDFFRSRDARRLARALLRQSMPATARRLLRRRLAVGRGEPGTRVLLAAATLLEPWHRPSARGRG